MSCRRLLRIINQQQQRWIGAAKPSEPLRKKGEEIISQTKSVTDDIKKILPNKLRKSLVVPLKLPRNYLLDMASPYQRTRIIQVAR